MIKSKTRIAGMRHGPGMGSAARLDATVRCYNFTNSVVNWQAQPVVGPLKNIRREAK